MAQRLTIVFVIVAVGILFSYAFSSDSALSTHGAKFTTPTGATMALFIADTDSEREKGLGGRTSLGENEGMLFIFPETGVHTFWMKGMRFPLDIVWLSDGMKVVHLEANVGVDTYPTLFGAGILARYVLELSAGTAEKSGIAIGSTLSLE